MPRPGEQLQTLLPRELAEDGLRLLLRHPRVVLAVQQEDGAGHPPGVIHGVVLEPVEAVLHPSPEDQEPGAGEAGHPHGVKNARASGSRAALQEA